MHIKTNDQVKVIAGADVGTTGKVLRIDRKKSKVVVEGVGRVYKHVRRSQKNPQGGRLNREMPIDLSNVQLICGKCGKPTRTGSRVASDGSKERYCKKCDASLGTLTPAKKKAAKKSS